MNVIEYDPPPPGPYRVNQRYYIYLYIEPPENIAVLCIMFVCKEDENIYLDSAEWTKHGPGSRCIGVVVYRTPRFSFHVVMDATLPAVVNIHADKHY